MAKKNSGTFLIDDSIPEKERNAIFDKVKERIENMKTEIADRKSVIDKRQDFYEGRHHLWTNVIGQTNKQSEGHILAVYNYILRFCLKVQQALVNSPAKLKIKGTDESDEIETARAEAVEKAVYKVLRDNKFFKYVYDKCTNNQIRDGDFVLECKVVESEDEGKHVEITPIEDLLKVGVGWDDLSGSSFSFVFFTDKWSIQKIEREWGYKAEPISETANQQGSRGSHNRDEYGVFASAPGMSTPNIPPGQTKLPKAEITDYWGYEVIKGKIKVINIIKINNEMVQFVVSDYKRIPKFVGHSFLTAGKAWSMSFIDPLVDPQIELNDRSSEEGDLIRVGSYMKWLVVNMPDFDPNSITPGSGQCIFIEGENADFRPLINAVSNVPNEAYINRVMEHMFNLGLPKITLAAGTAPYTGRVGAIQYQPFSDVVDYLRGKWEVVLEDLTKTIQEYFIDYFPELHPIMREHIIDPVTNEGMEGELIVRDVEFNWDNVLPLSRSDKVVDASTMRDRGAISLHTYLEEAGFQNPGEEIKKLKKETKDPDLMVIRQQFAPLSEGVTKAELEKRKEAMAVEEANAQTTGALEAAAQPSPKSTPPLLTPDQNQRRGISAAGGTPTGQVRTQKGMVDMQSQNMNAKAGV